MALPPPLPPLLLPPPLLRVEPAAAAQGRWNRGFQVRARRLLAWEAL